MKFIYNVNGLFIHHKNNHASQGRTVIIRARELVRKCFDMKDTTQRREKEQPDREARGG